MVDMLDGLTLGDYGLEVGEDFDKASKEDKAKNNSVVFRLFKNYIKKTYKMK